MKNEEKEEKKSKKEKKEEKKERKRREREAAARNSKIKKFGVLLGIVLLIGGGGYLWYNSATAPGKYDDVAQCLTKKGVKMFGAYWCPHCQNQKKEFGNSWQYVDYIECSLPGGNGQTKECNEAKIESYPTWEFADGERKTGEIPVEELAETAGCANKLPASK
jgi:hypothetical protein